MIRQHHRTPPLLEVEQLQKEFAGRTILQLERFCVGTGEAVLLVGRNGAGKSTLLRILAGLESADNGQIRLNGVAIGRRNRSLLCGQVIYLHQQPYLFDTSVRSNIEYGLRSTDLSAKARRERVEQALEWSGLAHLSERHARTLSGGEKQRIALARAWVLRPALLLLDEPTANMDGEAREQTYFLIRRLVNEGTAVVLTSHGIKTDHPMLSRTLLLEQGKLHPLPHSSRQEPPSTTTAPLQLGRQQL